MSDNTAPKRTYLRVCRNPHEPFFWDADTPNESCPDPHCPGGPHDTYITLATRKPVEDGRLLRRVEAFLSSITEWDGPSGDELDGLLADVRAALDQGGQR